MMVCDLASASTKPRRQPVDLSYVPPQQDEIHERLLNWARACWGPPGSNTSPMFRQYRSTEVWQGVSASVPVDQRDAAKIAKGVQALPEPHMRALGWFYVRPGPVTAIRRQLACTAEMVNRYVVDGRQMLVNRRV